jgi:carbon-monoxide dehydrogenase medium subunit
MRTFEYQRPTSVAEVAAALKASPDARPLAGGMTLIPALKLRLATPELLVDMSGLADLRGVSVSAGTITVGAMTRHVDVERSGAVREALPALAELAGGIGDPQVRNRGTIGGSLANNDPSADYPAAVLGLGATVVTNERSIPADAFFTGMFSTALEPGEIITSVSFPVPKGAAYEKFKSPASRYALVGVFVARTASGVRVAVTGAGACAFRVKAMETALTEKFAAQSIASVRVPADELNSDMHADAQYRAHLIGVLARRAVEKILAAEAKRG